jgi:uncharacterized protein YecE (DUF72 family)
VTGNRDSIQKGTPVSVYSTVHPTEGCCDAFITLAPVSCYFRLYGIGGYRYRYWDEGLERLAEWCEGRTFCLFNNMNMAKDADRFLGIAVRR